MSPENLALLPFSGIPQVDLRILPRAGQYRSVWTKGYGIDGCCVPEQCEEKLACRYIEDEYTRVLSRTSQQTAVRTERNCIDEILGAVKDFAQLAARLIP